MSAKDIQLIVGKNRTYSGHTCICENVKYLFGTSTEMDVISVGKSGYLFEYEVKISRSDFKTDKRKGKYRWYGQHGEPCIPNWTPNYLYFVVPENLVSLDEVPLFAGLYYIIDGGMVLQRKAKLMHKEKHSLDKIQKKVITVYQERHFLGGCLMTIKNKEIKEANKRHAELYT
jgi:hypothetical protein